MARSLWRIADVDDDEETADPDDLDDDEDDDGLSDDEDDEDFDDPDPDADFQDLMQMMALPVFRKPPRVEVRCDRCDWTAQAPAHALQAAQVWLEELAQKHVAVMHAEPIAEKAQGAV